MARVKLRSFPARSRGIRRGSLLSELLLQSCQNRFLIREDFFLVRKNPLERALVLLDDPLVCQNRLLVFQNGRLMAQDSFLIRYNLLV
jgi:hypothetical protein